MRPCLWKIEEEDEEKEEKEKKEELELTLWE